MNQLVLHLNDLTEEQAQWLEDTFQHIDKIAFSYDLPQDDFNQNETLKDPQ